MRELTDTSEEVTAVIQVAEDGGPDQRVTVHVIKL